MNFASHFPSNSFAYRLVCGVLLSTLCIGLYTPVEAQEVYNSLHDTRFNRDFREGEKYEQWIRSAMEETLEDYSLFTRALRNPDYQQPSEVAEYSAKRIEERVEVLERKDNILNDVRLRDATVICLQRIASLYRKEAKQYSVAIDTTTKSLKNYKELYRFYTEWTPLMGAARSEWQTTYEAFRSAQGLDVEGSLLPAIDAENPESMAVLDKNARYVEDAFMYCTPIELDAKRFEEIDANFTQAANNLDLEAMELEQRYMVHFTQTAFDTLLQYPKFRSIDGSVRSAALRNAKYYSNVGSKIYAGILTYFRSNIGVLYQERKNSEEYKAVVSDKSTFRSREEYLAYKNNPPSQKYTIKFEGLLKKYKEKVELNQQALKASITALFDANEK